MPTLADKKRWLANAELAHTLWLERVKPEQVIKSLAYYKCGTQACFGGHLATWPEFQEQGVRTMQVEENRYDFGMPWIDAHPLPICGHEVGVELFGSERMFAARHTLIDFEHLTDWQVVEQRLVNRIEELQQAIAVEEHGSGGLTL